MQTFLPHPDLQRSLECLDYRRLGKQRVEAFQLINVISGATQKRGWVNHPAAVMWRGHLDALKLYQNLAILEWIKRGYNNTMKLMECPTQPLMPSWFGDAAFHASHRSNLLRKDPIYYGQFGWTEPATLPYIWPK